MGGCNGILGPLPIDDPADVRDAVDKFDIDTLAEPAGAAGISCRGIVIGAARAAVVVILSLNPAGKRMRSIECCLTNICCVDRSSQSYHKDREKY